MHATPTRPPIRDAADLMIRKLHPEIVRLWRVERENHKSDDLVAIISTDKNQVRLDTRRSVYAKCRKNYPDQDLLIEDPAPGRGGAVVIWSVLLFPTGQVCILPVTLLRS